MITAPARSTTWPIYAYCEAVTGLTASHGRSPFDPQRGRGIRTRLHSLRLPGAAALDAAFEVTVLIENLTDTTPASVWALFLDVDGTLLDFAAQPHRVVVAPGLPALLARLLRGFDGGLALVSGRPISALDRLFAPYRFPAAGIHGLERRDAAGRWHFTGLAPGALQPARHVLSAAVQDHPELLLEDKGRSLALHYRQAPALAGAALEAARAALAALPPEAHLQPGRFVVEIKSGAADKGTAIAQFMDEAPFSGRVPVMIGDDLTDEDGFACVEARGGHAIEVGSATSASGPAPRRRARLASPSALRAWLQDIAAGLADEAAAREVRP